MTAIPLYREINELHELTGSEIRTKNPMFHCFDMADTNNLELNKTGPHRTSFYTLALNFGTRELSYTLNETTFTRPDNFLLCVAPGQIASWEKNDDWFGFCAFFKSEFLSFSEQINFLHQYPFFNINETNLIPVNPVDFEDLKLLFRQILEEQSNDDRFSMEIIKSHFQAILWKVRRLYENTIKNDPSRRAGSVITAQFQYLVNEHFLEKISVEEYAELLNITSNHLSQTIKKTTGSTAKAIINERRLNEARYLLKYTKQNVSEIAYHLKFSEPTHFIKFFKKQIAHTPQEYRLSKKRV